MRPRTPQEKKRLSLEKDRRNVYGESPHGARKSIPLSKKLRNRANRHRQESKLPVAPKRLEEDEADEIESSIRRKAPKRWNKSPDAPLGDVIGHQRQRRVDSQGRKTRSKAEVAILRGRFRGKCPTCRSDVYILIGRHGAERYGAFCAVGRGLPNPTFSKAAIRPCSSSELPEVARRLHSLCVDSGDSALGEWVCRLYGTSTCPQCRQPLDVAKVVAASETISRVCSMPTFPSLPEWYLRLRLSHWINRKQ